MSRMSRSAVQVYALVLGLLVIANKMDKRERALPMEGSENAQLYEASAGKLKFSLGFEGRRNNICYIADHILMHTCGNTIHFLNVSNMSVVYLSSVSGLGIGAVAIHPSKKYFAVCEKGFNPDIYIYEYPALKYSKVLKDGTERFFSAAAFKHDGSQLATVGGYPDYWLTVWDWENETIILRAKAFSQEVFNVNFSKYFSGQLLTSGVGHIRFWKMASTFTGMKLEGFIGKFGQVPLSDIAGYVELPNGKVLSGTEGGVIIVWEGELVKCQLKRKGGLPCHEGMIEIVIHDATVNELITCGADGYIRFWDFGTWLDAADDGDEKLICEVTPLRDLHVDPECRIKGIIFEADHWMIQDEGGALWKVSVPSFDLEQILEFHAGAIASIASSPDSLYVATAGSDATVRLYHAQQKKQLYKRRFTAPATKMIWIPLKVDPQAKTIAVGFADGVIRVLQQCTNKWRLLHAMKPHTMEVTGLKVSPDGELLATISSDATIFFFHCTEGYRPVGFCKTPAPVRCLDWSFRSEKLLIGCKNCEIVEVSRPELHPDTKLTYELSLPQKKVSFLLPKVRKPKPPPPPEPVKKKKKKEGEDGDGEQPDEEGGETEEASGEASADEPAPEGEGGTEEAPPPPVVEEVQPDEFSTSFQATVLLYTKSGMSTFYVSFEGKAGLLYECHADSKEGLAYAPWNFGTLTTLEFSHSSQFIVAGAADGVVRINTTPTPGQLGLTHQQKFWECNVHDYYTGKVGNCVLTCDDSYLVSVAEDGSFFLYEMNLDSSATKPDSKTADLDDSLPDSEDLPPGVYSIEDDKQKTELENKLRAALQKKKLVTDRVDRIRSELDALIQENKHLPPNERLGLQEFEIDWALRGIIENEIIEKITRARQQLQWESERSEIALSKLKAFFMDPLEVEHIVLHAFRTDSHVASFRTEKLSRDMKLLVEVRKSQAEKSDSRRESKILRDDSGRRGTGKGSEQIVTKQDIRRLQLKKKEDEYIAYLRTKPDESYVNPEDAAAIKHARDTKGDFKLKTDLTVIPPEEQRTNVTKKTNEMVILYEGIYTHKMDFNKELLSLKDKKKQIKFQIHQRNDRIVEINNLLRIREEPLYTPPTFKDETPEDRYNITKKDLDEYTEKLKKSLVKSEESKSGGFGGFGGGPVKKPDDKKKASDKAAEEARQKAEAQKRLSRKMSEKSRKTLKDGEISSVSSALRAPSVLEQAEQEAFMIKLRYEKSLLKEKSDMMIDAFDNDLDSMRCSRFQLDFKIKGAELKMLILYQELRLLQSLQPKEKALENKIVAKRLEAEDLLVKVAEQNEQIEEKKEEIAALQERKQDLLADFEERMGENNPHRDILLKIYTKKIKRAKPKAPGEESESEEESDLEDDGGSDEDFEEEEAPEVCPPGCDEALYNGILTLRERRLDVDDVLGETIKLLDALQKDKESKLKKKKGIDIALETIKREMGEYQKEKQNALNQIDVAVSMYMHQVEHIENHGVPEDLSRSLVFTNASLKQLRTTIERHVAEKVALRKFQKELKKEHTTLVRDRKTEEENTADTEQRVVDVQMLRFGQIIDLNVVELIRVRKDTIELKERVKEQELAYARELVERHRKVDEATDELARAMRENSASLYTIADLRDKINSIEQNMKLKAKATFRDPLIEKRRDASEHARLRQIVMENAGLIDDLERKIRMVRTTISPIFP